MARGKKDLREITFITTIRKYFGESEYFSGPHDVNILIKSLCSKVMLCNNVIIMMKSMN